MDFNSAIILLVEDDFGDQKLIKKALENERIKNRVTIVSSGEEALSYMEKSLVNKGDYPRPDLILLDLNMPGMGGKALLKTLKKDDSFKSIPVIVVTTSDDQQDIEDSYSLQASGYLKKPLTLRGFQDMMHNLEEYWFLVCKNINNRRMTV